MSEQILELIKTSQIRSLLGVSDEDLSDEEMDSATVELELQMSLDSDSIDYSTIISDIAASPTSEQTKRHNYLKLYTLYLSAVILIPRLRLLATQKVSDGDNSMERFLNPEFDKLENKYASKASLYKLELESAVSGTIATSPTYPQFGSASPTIDPVTR